MSASLVMEARWFSDRPLVICVDADHLLSHPGQALPWVHRLRDRGWQVG